jgi:hypothetical protein
MRHALKRLPGLLVHNYGWKLLSLAIAFVIWALVASEPELATFTTVGLEYNHLPEHLEISSEPMGTVVLELKGPSGELRRTGEGMKPAVVLDVSGEGPGMHTFTIGDGNVRLPRGVRLVRAIPAEVHLQLETRGQRTVPVQARWAGPEPAEYRIEPPAIGIEGPRSRVDRVTAAVTDPVDLTGITGAARIKVNVAVDDPYIRFQKAPYVMVDVNTK